MIYLKLFRKKSFILIIASLFMSVSCTQHEINRQRMIDNSLYLAYAEDALMKELVNSFGKNDNTLKSSDVIEQSKAVLDSINTEFGTNIVLPDEMHNFANQNSQTILNVSLSNGWITNFDKDLVEQFKVTALSEGLESAESEMETTILNANLTQEEFEIKNTAFNVIKIINNDFQDDLSVSESGPWDCFFAIISAILAAVSFVLCATIILCGLAVAAYLLAMRNVYKQCVE